MIIVPLHSQYVVFSEFWTVVQGVVCPLFLVTFTTIYFSQRTNFNDQILFAKMVRNVSTEHFEIKMNIGGPFQVNFKLERVAASNRWWTAAAARDNNLLLTNYCNNYCYCNKIVPLFHPNCYNLMIRPFSLSPGKWPIQISYLDEVSRKTCIVGSGSCWFRA